MIVNPVLNASVSIVESANSVCAGTSVTFTATAGNTGSGTVTYTIKVNGIVNRPKHFYINQTINSYEKNVVKNIKIMVPNMIHFFKKNKIYAVP